MKPASKADKVASAKARQPKAPKPDAVFNTIAAKARNAEKSFLAAVWVDGGQLHYQAQAKSFLLADRGEAIRLLSQALNELKAG